MNPNANSSTRVGPARVAPVHTAIRGRARFKVAGLHRSSVMKRLLERRLGAVAGIGPVSASELTGNVLVNFDESYNCESVAALIEQTVDAPGGIDGSCAALASADAVLAREQAREGWHTMEPEQVIARYGTSTRTGLGSATAARLLKEFGPNLLRASAARSQLAIATDQLISTPILLLIAAAGMSVLTSGLADAAIILGVVGLNAAIGYGTESQAERTISSLKRLATPSAMVVRDGKPQEIPAPQVVVGDLLMMRPGSYVAADARLVEVDSMSVDESTLTGESLPVNKIAGRLGTADLALGDRINMVYMGTLVTGGQGLAVVVATGRFTEMGHIQTLAAQAQAPRTPMQRQLDQMGRQLAIVLSGACAAVFGIGLLRGYPVLRMLHTSIALAVAAVPEGLPAIATTILAVGIARTRRQHVLIRRLAAAETLGCVGTICLDKTGTLTLNRMSVVAAYAGGRAFEVRSGAFWEDNRLLQETPRELNRLLQACVLCSEAHIEARDSAYVVDGSSTENALINLAIAARLDVMALRRGHPLVRVTLRSEDRSFMSTLHRRASASNQPVFLTAVKGSPAQVLSMCTHRLRDGAVVDLTTVDRHAIEAENGRMAGRALRVLGCAWREDAVEPANGANHDGLVWLGLVGLADPVRAGLVEVMQGFHRAGIETVMITGDQSPTAYAIASELELSSNGPLEIIDSTDLDNQDPGVLSTLTGKVNVFARVSPAHKLQIVRAMQQAGKVVAMTGDGINDGPALKAADIGIAMGHTGTDVAREVADVILQDDDLETMLIAVRQGRTIYSNVRKAVHFLLSTNLSELAVTFTAMAAGMGQPISAMQLLWINLISETSLGLALAMEPPEPGIMNQPPRNPGEPIVRDADLKRMVFESMALSAGALGAYGYGVARHGMGARAGTLAFTALTSGQILQAIPSRSERHTIFDRTPRSPNPILSLAVIASLALQGGVFVIPWLRNLLGVTTIDLTDALVIGAGTVIPLLVNETAKKHFVFQG